MPDENKDSKVNEGADNIGNDGTGAGDDKKADEDKGGDGEEVVTIKKSELEQIKTDRDNYRTATLIKKADERDLKNSKKADEDKGGEGENKAVVDETKVKGIAETAANETFRKASEKSAKRAFLQKHPEYVDDAEWQSLVSNLTFKGGEISTDDILDRMEAALLEHKRSTGKLDEYLNSIKNQARQEGRVEGQFDNTRSMGGAGDKGGGGKSGGFSSAKGEDMAKRMHTDPTKAAAIDPHKDNVINVV